MLQVSAGVILKDNLVLACQRRLNGAHGGKWEFPGGKREPGETAAACLRRELREELDIEATVGIELWRTVHVYAGKPPVELTFLLVTRYRRSPRNLAFQAIRWVDRRAMPGLDWLEADRPFVERLARNDGTLPGLPDGSSAASVADPGDVC